MAVVDRLIGFASPAAALRRSIQLKDQGRLAEAFALLAVAAKAGIPDAEHRVARCYLEGTGVPPSRSEGARWLERAAAHGCVDAQVLLSALCVRGLVKVSSGRADLTNRLFAGDAPSEPDFATSSGRPSRMSAASAF